MALYGFNEAEVARALAMFAKAKLIAKLDPMEVVPNDNLLANTGNVFLAKTVETGIPGATVISATRRTLGKAQVALYTTYAELTGDSMVSDVDPVGSDDDIDIVQQASWNAGAITGNSGSPAFWDNSDSDVWAFNFSTVAVPGNTFIICVAVDGVLVSIAPEAGSIAKTAVGGIPARSGAVAGSATDVAVVTIDGAGTLTETVDTIEVFNPFGTAISGGVYITVKSVGGRWIVDAEDCG